jgi:predicted flap endonuclease-1-like 5' DNA nuclease
MGQTIARQRLYLTKDRKKLVPEGDRKAATLYAVPGDVIPESAVQRFALVDGALKGFKEDRGGEDKERKSGVDKGAGQSGSAPQADDLVALKGVGAKTGAALAAAGFATFAAIAALDPASPPQVEGLPAVFKWADVIADAKAKAPADEQQS